MWKRRGRFWIAITMVLQTSKTEFWSLSPLENSKATYPDPFYVSSGLGSGEKHLSEEHRRCPGPELFRFSLGGMRDEAEIKGIDAPISARCRASFFRQ